MGKKIIVSIVVIAVLAAGALALLIFFNNSNDGKGTVSTSTADANSNPNTKPETLTQPEIIDKLLPITTYETRGSNPFTHIMLHFASNALNNPENPHDVNAIHDIFTQGEVSSHYFIDRDGKIYRFVDETNKAWHAGNGTLPGFPELENKMNDYSIGIEMAAVGSESEMAIYGITPEIYSRIPQNALGYTGQQYQSLKILLDDIAQRHNIAYDRSHIIGHDEYVPELRTDPGELFDWSQIGL